jgi:hypothetical protein
MIKSPDGCGLRYNGDDNAAGAQTGRRGGAGPVRALLGGFPSPAAYSYLLSVSGRDILTVANAR